MIYSDEGNQGISMEFNFCNGSQPKIKEFADSLKFYKLSILENARSYNQLLFRLDAR